jgi:hypothetical protein
MRRFSLRTLIVVTLLGAAGLCFVGYVCNAWAAWAPPGEVNPNYSRLITASLTYRDLALGCLSVAAGVGDFPTHRKTHKCPDQ